ncbi:MAG: AAA family ATPase, partial [Muribaculaceae bacterium]|nr:AAA family ATPase [Muribaculaceae bacterium]
YAEPINGKIYHYRDKNGLECDAICHLRDGRYGLIEIKLGGDNLIKEGEANLLKLKSSLDFSKMSLPSFMMILVGVGKYAYKNEKGIYIVPITCLKD